MEMGTDSRDVIVIGFTRGFRDAEVLLGLSGGDTPGLINGSAYTRPNDNIFDCSKRVKQVKSVSLYRTL
jgi:hypothetical protein